MTSMPINLNYLHEMLQAYDFTNVRVTGKN